MTGYPFTLGTARLVALPSGALHWPHESTLTVSDLHFGKSERMARRGGALLPPYDTRDTLARLDADLERTGAARVICLGDSFDDVTAAGGLEETDRLWLARLMAGRDWTWIEGNHDPGPLNIGGSHRGALHLGPLVLRHIATAEDSFQISGHYHPKARLAGRSFRCFLVDARQVILPAYGAYTGGLWCHDPVLTALMGQGALAILTGRQALPIPMPRT